MQSFHILAHAEQAHSTTGETFVHFFESADIALMAWLILSALVFALSKHALRLALPKTFLTLAGTNLLYGGFLYNKSPGIGALVVSTGFALTLAVVIVGLQMPSGDPSQTKG